MYTWHTCTTKLINEKEMIWRITYLNNLGTFIHVQHVDGAFLGMYERTVTPVKIFFTETSCHAVKKKSQSNAVNECSFSSQWMFLFSRILKEGSGWRCPGDVTGRWVARGWRPSLIIHSHKTQHDACVRSCMNKPAQNDAVNLMDVRKHDASQN